MSDPVPSWFTNDALARFFADRQVPAFCVADSAKLRAPAGRHPRDILPSCRTIIIVGMVMTDRLFAGPAREQGEETRRIAGALESAARDLGELLRQDGASSVVITPSLPLEVADGVLRGRLSLKHCAADAGFGTLGDNTLLIHPVYGNRIALAAVITDRAIAPTPPGSAAKACRHCNRCRAACPAGALDGGAVAVTRCRNLTDYVPRPVQPLVWRLMRGKRSARLMTRILNGIALHYDLTATCTACLTACPYFPMGER